MLQSIIHLHFSLSVAALVLPGVLWKSYSLPICSSIIATKGHLSCVERFTFNVFLGRSCSGLMF